jgi:ATP dependent DNA ligase-like protein
MAFGPRDPKHIREPLCEPLWAGRRVLVEIDAERRDVTIRDHEGMELEGFTTLKEALAAAALAFELVADGYVLPAPLHSSPGAEVTPGSESVMTPSQVTRQMFLGGGGRNARKEALELAEARKVYLAPDDPVAFVAIDLVWLDGEPLIDLPLLERKRLLESALADAELVRRSVAVRPPVETWYAQWKALGFQEIAVKSANSRYTPGGVSNDWATAAIPRR